MLKIVDGQQRIITSAIFLICVRDYFYTKGNEKNKAKDYFNTLQEILYEKNNDFEVDENKFFLTLSRTNSDFFNKYIVPKKNVEKLDDIKIEATNNSNEYLADAYLKLLDSIKKFATKDESGFKKLNHLMWSLLKKFMIIEWEVSSDLEAYRMFDLINNRGIRLANSDLVKNILFGKLDENINKDPNKEQVLDDYDIKWSELRDNITGHKDADYELDVFFHHYLMVSKSKNIKLNKVFEEFDEIIKNKTDPKKTIDSLFDWSKIFTKLRNPTSEFKKHDVTIHYLNKIRNIKSTYVYTVLMAGYKQYWQNGDKKTFDKLVEISFKYHLRIKSLGIGTTLDNYQNKIYDVLKIINIKKGTIKDIVEELVKDENTYPSNDKLRDQLKTLKVTNSNVAIALLEEIEKTFDGDKHSGTSVSIEHIMPKSFTHWRDYILEKHSDIYTSLNDDEKVKTIHTKNCNMLGNQTLLSDSKNKKNSNKSFNEKRKNYETDGYKITKLLSKKTDWTEDTIKNRQEEFTSILVDTLDLKKFIGTNKNS